MTIAREFAEHCAGLSYDDLDERTVDYAKKLLLDSIGTAVGGYHWSDTADVVVAAGRSLGHEPGPGGATVLGTGERRSPENAALVNGALSHSLDYDNRHSRGSLHVGSSVVPAALAAAEAAGADGRRLLEGVLAGYDVATRLGMACNPRSSHERGFHPTGTCGTFGATAAVGVVYGFSADEFVAAFGVNGSQASGSYECSLTGGWNKRIHPGLAARDAFVGAAFAGNGFEGPTAPIEGDLGFLQAYADRPRPDRATESLGVVYEAERTKIKPYPVGTFAHVPIALLVELVEEEGIEPEAVESIRVALPTSGAAMFGRSAGDGHPTTSAEAQFDMPFAAALAVTYGRAGLDAFDDALSGAYAGPFRHVMEATTVVASDELEESLPERYPALVTVRTREATYERSRDWVVGEPDHPMSWGRLGEKFDELTRALDRSARGRVLDVVRGVEAHPVAALVEPLRSAATSDG